MKRTLIVGLALIGLAGVGWFLSNHALATSVPIFNQPIVDKLVERFNLNEDEVVGVFDEAREERQQQMEEQWRTRMEERLDEAVSDGVLTTDQKQALLDKQTEMQEKHQQLREEWRQWQEQSGIDFEALAPYRVGFGCGGKGFGRGFGGGHPFSGF